MFKSLIAKYAADYAAKAILAATTIAVAKGYTTKETAASLASHLTDSVTILIAIAVTTGVKALNDNTKAIIKK
jgi:hypothetical protein